MTHDQLCDIAVRWLKRPESQRGPGCACAFKEVASVSGRERADAWGYSYSYGGGSIVVEVKVSRSDFLSDRQKPHRKDPRQGMGEWRYYMCPEGIIKPEDLPERWGLLWVNKRGHVKLVAGAACVGQVMGYNGRWVQQQWKFTEYNQRRELNMMAYLLRRVGDPDALLERERETYRIQNRLTEQMKTDQKTLREEQRTRNKMARQLRRYEEKFGPLPGEEPGYPIGRRTMLDI